MPFMGISESKGLDCLDFEKFLHGSPEEQRRFCDDLAKAFSDIGFVKLINHGITEEDLKNVFEWNAKFFSLSEEAKAKAAHAVQPNPHRGYSYVGQEKLSRVRDFEKGHFEDMAVLDVKESFDQGAADDDRYPNRWPDNEDLPGFRAFMEHFYGKCHAAHMNLLRAIALSLQLPPTYLQERCNDNTSELRLNHYPPIDLEAVEKGAMRISEHTDFGTVTLLFQDAVGGLEVEDQAHRGQYLPVMRERAAEMVVNIGDCLQRWTNDKFRSTSHRVTLPPKTEHAGDRYSVAYFAKPNRDQTVGPLPRFEEDGPQGKYDHVTAWEYNQQKLVRTY